jgi:LysM repeat protein
VLLLAAPAAHAATYTVRYGDTLTGIARAHHVSLHRLASQNHISVYGILQTGRSLWVPGRATRVRHRRHAHHRRRHHTRRVVHHVVRPRHLRAGIHTVRSGESLSLIASRYHSSIRILCRVNHRTRHQVLLVGTRLWIPLPNRRRHHRAVRHAHHRRVVISQSHAWVVGKLDYWARRYSIDRHLVRAIGWQESGWNPAAVSPVGARGVLQVMPGTWEFTTRNLIGHSVAHTAGGGIQVGVAYLRSLLRIFHGNVRLSVAAYYQGPGAVQQYGVFGISEPYVRNVLALRRVL